MCSPVFESLEGKLAIDGSVLLSRKSECLENQAGKEEGMAEKEP